MAERQTPPTRGLSRRHLFGAGAAALGAAGLGWGAQEIVDHRTTEATAEGGLTEPFHGPHQGGIATPPQAHAQFVGVDLRENADRATVAGLLKVWTQDAARLTAGTSALADTEPELAATPARLTVTVGLGPGVFGAADVTDRQPSWLRPLPAFPIDRLNENSWGQTDLLLQVCADDPVTVAHAVRVLTKNVRSLVTVRWSQRGFRNARRSHPEGTTMRNLMGQVDGTVNPDPDTEEFDRLVWDDGSAHRWLTGGTSLVLRRIRMELDTWEEIDRPGRELTVGRTLDTGAPLTGTDEHDDPDFTATDRFGIPVIPPGSHIARAHHTHDGERFHRRAYNYDDPPQPGQVSNSGLIFASYQRDIDTQFLPVQQRLAEFDALNQWTTPIGSAVYALPPGTDPGGYLGDTLLEATA
ncbi:Dyp-type peroxidase [Rhodococcus opacus]|uniref:Putative peroxidase n=1 Tax=Rhodococcus opacus (strain B4) TaxID=632772 RepID=C1B6J9_RHOOB|nr:Dyp-type peroxidase [Rhodococcus opacus]BAH51302.1 putative peroxidase [Rhodococcus opacus B4]